MFSTKCGLKWSDIYELSNRHKDFIACEWFLVKQSKHVVEEFPDFPGYDRFMAYIFINLFINIWFAIRRLNKYILYAEGLSKGTQATQSVNEQATQSVNEQAAQSVNEQAAQSVNEQAAQSVNEQAAQSVNEQAAQSVNEQAAQSVNEQAAQSVNEMKCTNEKMTCNTQDTNRSWYVPKAMWITP